MTNRRRRRAQAKKKNTPSALTQDYLNELNKHTLPGYEHYLHSPQMGQMGPLDDYDMDAAWNNDRYYNGSGGHRYKVCHVILFVQYDMLIMVMLLMQAVR